MEFRKSNGKVEALKEGMTKLRKKLMDVEWLANVLEKAHSDDAKEISKAKLRVGMANKEAKVACVETKNEKEIVAQNIEKAQKVKAELDALYTYTSQVQTVNKKVEVTSLQTSEYLYEFSDFFGSCECNIVRAI
ncbi:hypothetical protein V6N13_106795 [Hibiscus sabdariffa]